MGSLLWLLQSIWDLPARRSIWRCLELSEFLAQCLWTASAISSRIETFALLPHHKSRPYMLQKWKLTIITSYPLYIPVVPRIYDTLGIAGAFSSPIGAPQARPRRAGGRPGGSQEVAAGAGKPRFSVASYGDLAVAGDGGRGFLGSSWQWYLGFCLPKSREATVTVVAFHLRVQGPK